MAFVFTNVSEEATASIFKVDVKMQAAGPSEMSVTSYETAPYHNQEVRSLKMVQVFFIRVLVFRVSTIEDIINLKLSNKKLVLNLLSIKY
jgi:hypothetical protein